MLIVFKTIITMQNIKSIFKNFKKKLYFFKLICFHIIFDMLMSKIIFKK
jgi:hypothetical protein